MENRPKLGLQGPPLGDSSHPEWGGPASSRNLSVHIPSLGPRMEALVPTATPFGVRCSGSVATMDSIPFNPADAGLARRSP